MSTLATPWPIKKQLPSSLAFLLNPIAYYFGSHPPYNNVILQALIFTPPPEPPRILFLQRSGGTDPHAFSQFWQVPSGRPLHGDQTMLQTLSRVVFEQTGLQLSHVATMSGTEFGAPAWQNGPAQWMRMLFMVEVEEMALLSAHSSQDPERLALEEEFDHGGSDSSMELDSIPILMNLEKHRMHVWATEEDLKSFVKSGLYPTEETEQYQIMLEAFAFYRQDFDQMDYLRRARESKVMYKRTGS